jgi:hypothetical protein
MNTTETNEMAGVALNSFHANVGQVRRDRAADVAYLLNTSATQLSRTDLTGDERLKIVADFQRLFDYNTEDLRDALVRELRFLSVTVQNIGR